MRDCFTVLPKEMRHQLLEKVLKIVPKKKPERNSVRNLFTERTTEEKVINDILFYLCNFGYPKDRGEEYSIGNILDWKRKSGRIKIKNPKYVLTVQKIDGILTTLQKISAYLPEELYGVSIGDVEIGSEKFLKLLYEIKESKDYNDRHYSSRNIQIKKEYLRMNHKQNMWVTWNEVSPDAIPNLLSEANNGELIFRLLGLGFNLEDLKGNYIALCFDISNSDDIELYRPGWGDATTYYYWESIKDENAPYGYTKPINQGSEHRQPEAVSENANFHIGIISSSSSVIKFS